MAVLYKSDQPLDLGTPETGNNPFETKFQQIYKFRFLIPLFPKWNENWGKFWYLESYFTILAFAVFFYILTLYFIYLGITDRNHITSYLLVALGYFLIGLILPAAIYRLVAYFLLKEKIVR